MALLNTSPPPRNTYWWHQSSRQAEAAFRAEVGNLDAKFAPGAVYRGPAKRAHLICKAGHDWRPMPSHVMAGLGSCGACERDELAAAAEAAVRAEVTKCGATLAPGATYRGAGKRVHLICKAGHHWRVLVGYASVDLGFCRGCDRADRAAWAAAAVRVKVEQREAFLTEVGNRGAKLAPDATYRGTDKPVHLICKAGHDCRPAPAHVLAGAGHCRQCGTSFDRVYLLEHAQAHALKVGVASSDKRVKTHIRSRYAVVAQWRGLEHTTALAAEKAILAFWRTNGWPPVAAAPRDGITETASLEHLAVTRAQLAALLGPAA